MSFATYISGLDTALTSYGFKRNTLNLPLISSFDKNKYTIDVETLTQDFTSGKQIHIYQVKLDASFIINSTTDYDNAVSKFSEIMGAINAIDGFGNFINNAVFERFENDNKKLIATVTFNLGYYKC